MVVQGGNPATPAAKARAPGANAAARSRPASEKVAKVAGVKRKKIPATKKPPPSSAHSVLERGAPGMPLNGAAPPTSEVFDEMAGRYASSVMVLSFRFHHLLLAHDLLSFNIAVVQTMELSSS